MADLRLTIDGVEKGTYPGLKMPSPAFNIERLKAGDSTGLLSRVERKERIGVEQVLLNELNKPEDSPFAFGIVKIGKGEQYTGIGTLPQDVAAGIDEFTLREFQRERIFWYHPFELVRAFEAPIPLSKPVPGRRFASEVDVQERAGRASPIGKEFEEASPPSPFVIESNGAPRRADAFVRLADESEGSFVAVLPGQSSPWLVFSLAAKNDEDAVMEAGELAAVRQLEAVHFARMIGAVDGQRPVFEVIGVVRAMDDVGTARLAVQACDPVRLADLETQEVRLLAETLRRFYTVHFEGRDATIVEDLSREDVVNAYIFAVRDLRRRSVMVEPRSEIDSEAMDLDPRLFEESPEVEKRVGAQLWGSPAGKSRIAYKLLPLFPEHRTYVEPFAGGAACLYAKEASAVEVIADTDDDLVRAFKIVKGLSDEDIRRLRAMDWKITKDRFERWKKGAPNPANKLEWFRWFALLRTASYFCDHHEASFHYGRDGTIATVPNRIEAARDRLKAVRVYQSDYRDIVKQYDAADTFFFFDPPYTRTAQGVGEKKFDHQEFWRILSSLKGKWLVTYDAPGPLKGTNVRQIESRSGHPTGAVDYTTYCIANYEFPRARKAAAEDGREFATTHPSGEKKGRPINLDEVLEKIKPFRFRQEAVMIVGGLATHRETENDIDVLIRGPLDDATKHVLKFRIGRMLGPELSQRVQFLDADEYGGPFTDHIPLGHLVFQTAEPFEVKQMRDPAGKQDDPLLDLPKEKGKRPAVVHLHFRGKTVHADFRVLVRDYLIGWTMPIQKEGAVREPVTTLEQARAIARGYDPETGNRYLKPMLAPGGLFATPKSRQPKVWLDVGDSVFPPGTVGATRNFPGVILEIDRPKVEFGRQESRFHEYFVTDSKIRNGVWFFRLLVGRAGEDEGDLEAGRVTPAGETFWKFAISKEYAPSILKPRTVGRGDMPPDGWSWIPESLERDIQPEFRYWEKRGAEAKKLRDALVEEKIIRPDDIEIVDGEFRLVKTRKFVAGPDGLIEVGKVLRQPWRQYGGSGRYARWLADRLPAHKVYVEPFAGAAAVLLVKEPAGKEVIADIDPEIVFAFKYIQALNPQKIAALRRFDWVSSRDAYNQARARVAPKSDAERFWKFAFGRFCAFSGVPGMHGYNTGGEGSRYDVSDLLWIRERLKDVTVLQQDWRKTIEQFDGPDTLFFIDPPYVGEWDTPKKGFEISASEIAAAVSRLKGDFVIAYTDSPAARRAFAKLGHGRRLDMQETRTGGGVKSGTRFFASSFRIAKSEADEVEKQPDRVGYTISRQSFRGPIQIRAGFSKVFWWLVLDRPGRADVWAWRLLANPASEDREIAAVEALPDESKDKALLDLSGFQEPGSRFNATKDTPSDVEIEGRGRVEILDEREGFLRLRFLSGPMRGVRTLAAEEPKSDLWELRIGSAPGAPAKSEIVTAAVPTRSGVQIWDPGRKARGVERTDLQPLAIFTPMKPRQGWFEPDKFLEEWPTPAAFKSGIDVEPKYNGLRTVAEVDGDDRVLIYFEDSKDDRSKILPGVAEELREIGKKLGPFILDAELIDLDADGDVQPRRTLSRFTGPVKPQDDSGVRLEAFRLLYADGKNLTALPRSEARPLLEEFVRKADAKHVRLAPSRRAKSPEDLARLIRWATDVPGSEGAMFKLAESTYSLGGFTSSWAKLKIPRTIHAIVIERILKKPGPEQRAPAKTFVYRGAIGPIPENIIDKWEGVTKIGDKWFVEIGRTFATNVQAKAGDVLEVQATELLIDETGAKKRIRWFTPVVVDLTERRANTIDEVRELAFDHEVKRPVEKFLDREVVICKAEGADEEEERIAYGIVLEPETVDSQGDVYSPEEIRKAAHAYMEHYRHAGLMHRTRIDGRVRILESFVAPCELSIAGVKIKKGTWLMAMRVVDDDLWSKVKDGRLAGFSIGGSAIRERLAA